MSDQGICWRSSNYAYALLGLAALVTAVGFADALSNMIHRINSKEEYGYAYLIPFITLFFIWQRKNLLLEIEFSPSWFGVIIALLGGGLFFVGAVATTHTVSQYAMLLVVLGMTQAIIGWRAFRIVAVPLILLFFMVPLPPFIYNTLSTKLQLISSEIGVSIIRLFGISVYLEGNVIDLGVYKLQVVEACSGLRYLFPLVSLSFIAAYIYKAEFWKKAFVFLSSIPITIFMNSFRIGVIGVLVEYYGIDQAEGFLHDFEGWIIFMACMAILLLEMIVLSKVGRRKGRLSDVFLVEFPESVECVQRRLRPVSLKHYAVLALAALIFSASYYEQERVEKQLTRQSFDGFPLEIEGWEGRGDRLEQIYLDGLRLDDYILADYVGPNNQLVNFYVAYYSNQQAGEAAHSPKACIPGGGWLIKKFSVTEVPKAIDEGGSLKVNRLVIKKGGYTQLVYYWFQQRGRIITNEYMVKWYLFWDSLTKNRTDGALVRLTTFVPPGQDLAEAEARLQDFSALVIPRLQSYIPE